MVREGRWPRGRCGQVWKPGHKRGELSKFDAIFAATCSCALELKASAAASCARDPAVQYVVSLWKRYEKHSRPRGARGWCLAEDSCKSAAKGTVVIVLPTKTTKNEAKIKAHCDPKGFAQCPWSSGFAHSHRKQPIVVGRGQGSLKNNMILYIPPDFPNTFETKGVLLFPFVCYEPVLFWQVVHFVVCSVFLLRSSECHYSDWESWSDVQRAKQKDVLKTGEANPLSFSRADQKRMSKSKKDGGKDFRHLHFMFEQQPKQFSNHE